MSYKREIGGEFWKHQLSACPDHAYNIAYLLSGRTALKFIIDDICQEADFRKILLPSYCCESMIKPFLTSGIEVQFYSVCNDHLDYPYKNDADAVLLIDFFGYTNLENEKIAQHEEQSGKIIIYDATHKINGNCAVESYAKYSFCSYRKWFYCNFAQATKNNGFFHGIMQKTNDRYIALRDAAARKKARYFADASVGKDGFLSMFSEAERILDEDYVGYVGDPIKFDLHEITAARRKNAAFLINELKDIPEIQLWRYSLGTDDVPLFVPLLVNPIIRNGLRHALIEKHIYCPIHWPVSALHGECNELYDTELSLICDQRYSTEDMERIVQVIQDYFKK